MTTVRDFMAQPSLHHEPRPVRVPPVRVVCYAEFEELALAWGSVVEVGSPPRVVTADGARYELERVAS